MITIGEMQISGMLTMTVLAVMLALCVPHRSIRKGSFAKARWLMATGTGLIALQFLLQHTFGFRQMGVTQAVLLNLLFFTPASLLCSMAILYLQRQGHVSQKEWLTSWTICGLSFIILIGTVLTDGVPIQQESQSLRMAEYAGGMLYVVMQSYIFIRQYWAYLQLKQAVDEYYDRSRRDLFGWMGLSMRAMAVLAFFVPVVIFMNGVPLVVFSVAYFFCISYSVISLYSYGISKDVERVEESFSPILTPIDDGNFMDDGNPVTQGVRTDAQTDSLCESVAVDNYSLIITSSLEHWIASGHYREHNLTLSIVARQMGVPQRQLQEWLRQSEYGRLAGLVTKLRIEEAMRMLVEHPEWSVETIADHCGFNDRKYFHYVFQQHTGTTPSKFQLSHV